MANTDLSQLVLQRLRQGLTKRLRLAQSKLEQLKQRLSEPDSSSQEQNGIRHQKIEQLEQLLSKAESFLTLLEGFPKLKSLFSLKLPKIGGRK